MQNIGKGDFIMPKVALQLYSIADKCSQNFEDVLKNVANIGYDGIELYSFFDYSKEEMKALLNKYNLKCIASHTSYESLKDNLEYIIDYNNYIGTEYIILPWFKGENADEWFQLADFLKSISAKLCENGLKLLYHNHQHELEKLDNGKNALEILLKNTNQSELNLEVDCYWIEYADVKIANFLNEHADRITLLHIKDMKIENGQKMMTEVGTGIIDYKNVLKFADENNMEWLIIEQDEIFIDEYESIKISFNFLK